MECSDTSDDARDRQIAVFRAMEPADRVAMAVDMSEMAFALSRTGIRSRHPDYDDEQIRLADIRLRIGDALFAACFPDVAPPAP